jgi:spoIIIJ-associated protein
VTEQGTAATEAPQADGPVEEQPRGDAATDAQDGADLGPSDGADLGPSDGADLGPSDDADLGPSDGADEGQPAGPGAAEPPTDRAAGAVDRSSLERESEIAADYLEELLDIADLDGDIDMDVERDRAAVSIVGGDLSHLVGPDGEVLEALQELTRLAVHTQTGARSRLMLDVGGYRAGRRAVLTELGRSTAEQVRSTGEVARLDPMSPFERKIVHDAVAAAGLRSESEGQEPQRRVVVLPE